MCRLLGVSRSGYYAWRGREESARAREDRRLTKRIKAIYDQNRRTYGAPRVYEELRKAGETCGKNRVARLMDEAGLKAHVQRRRRVKTTDSKHSFPVAPNLLKGRAAPQACDEVWVSDITYIGTEEGWLYLAVVMDLHSRRIVGYAMQKNLKASLAITALDMALKGRSPAPGLIHHSDRGSQYASHAYQRLLRDHGAVASMSRKGNCYDNAAMESFFRSLKTELVYREDYQTREEARASVFDYVAAFYNGQRSHSSLGYVSPVEFEAKAA
jgi:transposase InsO family protein